MYGGLKALNLSWVPRHCVPSSSALKSVECLEAQL